MKDIEFELKNLSVEDGLDVYEMLQEIPAEEARFHNDFNKLSLEEFKEELKVRVEQAQGRSLPEGYVAQTIFWLYVNGKPVGYSKLRHELTDHLRKEGGNIGYGIRPSERGKGYAKKMLTITLSQARKIGLDKVLITTDIDNVASRKVVEANGGVMESESDGSCYYWITL